MPGSGSGKAQTAWLEAAVSRCFGLSVHHVAQEQRERGIGGNICPTCDAGDECPLEMASRHGAGVHLARRRDQAGNCCLAA